MHTLPISRSIPRSPSVAAATPVPRIGTHDGVFHCDEVLGTWLVMKTKRFRNAVVIRTRDSKILEEADLVLDVGGIYDPESFRFDHHHQTNFNEVFEGRRVKLSSAGLIYRHFGKEVLQEVLHPLELSEEDLHALYRRMYEHLVEAVDAIDNGISNCRMSDANYQDKTNLITRVGMLNLTWRDRLETNVTEEMQNERFSQAMDVCGGDFIATAQFMARNWLPAMQHVRKAVEDRFSISPTGKIILVEPSCPWKEHLITLEEEMKIRGLIQYCIHFDNDIFYVQSVPDGMTTFRTRTNLPQEWRGRRGVDLDRFLVAKGCVFVHQLGYIGGHRSRQGAIEMAEKALLLA